MCLLCWKIASQSSSTSLGQSHRENVFECPGVGSTLVTGRRNSNQVSLLSKNKNNATFWQRDNLGMDRRHRLSEAPLKFTLLFPKVAKFRLVWGPSVTTAAVLFTPYNNTKQQSQCVRKIWHFRGRGCVNTSEYAFSWMAPAWLNRLRSYWSNAKSCFSVC